VEEIHFTTDLSNGLDVGRVVKIDSTPVLGDHPWQYLFHDIVLELKPLQSRAREHNVGFAEFLKPHLKVMKPMRCGYIRFL
jgi:hypothetical protein